MKHLLLIVGFIISSLSYGQSQVDSTRSNEIDIYASVLGLKGGDISKEKLLNAETIDLNGTDLKVDSFRMAAICKNKETVYFENKVNNRINQEMKDLIKKAEPGCEIFFANVRTNKFWVSALTFIIK